MLPQPRINDPANPLVSVFVYEYQEEYLEACFNRILNQTVLDNIEIVYIDNSTFVNTWKIALAYAEKHKGFFTLKKVDRNEYTNNPFHSRKLSKGKYSVTLIGNEKFVPEYVKQCIAAMEADPLASFKTIKRISKTKPQPPNLNNQPLVNVLVYNFNYGRFLAPCLESIFSQSYDNYEIIFSDNASTDESWDIANDFARRYRGKMTLIQNRTNFGPNKNLENCYENIKGKYFFVLCSDDAIRPGFIEQCVNALEANSNAGFVITHRCLIDQQGNCSEEPPFYNQSCVIPGAEQAAVYMMAAVNPSISQVMYDHEKARPLLPDFNLLSRWYSQRFLDFILCCQYDVAYIKEPLLVHRMHPQCDTSQNANSLIELFGQYLLPHHFKDIATGKNGMSKAIGRLPAAIDKLSTLCLRYCTNALLNDDEATAVRYFHLSVAIRPEIRTDPVFLKIQQYWVSDEAERMVVLDSLKSTVNLAARSISYDPPPGSVPLAKQQAKVVDFARAGG